MLTSVIIEIVDNMVTDMANKLALAFSFFALIKFSFASLTSKNILIIFLKNHIFQKRVSRGDSN